MQDQTTTTNQSSQAFGAMNDLFWDTWTQSIGMTTWGSEQAEKLVRSWMDQGRVSREEGAKLQREMIDQARKNQQELQALIARTVQEQTEAYRTTVQQQLDDMRRRMDELNAELRSYREKMAG